MTHSTPTIQPTPRATAVKPFLAMEIMERAKELERQGREIIYLCLGEPDFPTPKAIRNAAIRAMEGGDTIYTHSLGTPDLREEIVRHYQRRYGVTITADQVLISSGTSPLMQLLFSALLEPGDEILLTDPCYACYPSFISYPGGKPVYIPCTAENGFQPDPAEVRPLISARTKGILLNSPSNPAGSIIDRERFTALAGLGIPLISDEIYHGLTYEGEELTALSFCDQAFVFGGFSKSFAMTGWRLGYLIVPPSWSRTMQCLHQNFFICANSFVQQAGITALRECWPEVEEMRHTYDERRVKMAEGLRKLGLGVPRMPVGAFYILADARHLGSDSIALAKEILEETGVAVTPGIDFGSRAEGHLRFSYANSLENIDLALERLAAFIAKRTT